MYVQAVSQGRDESKKQPKRMISPPHRAFRGRGGRESSQVVMLLSPFRMSALSFSRNKEQTNAAKAERELNLTQYCF